MSERIAGIVVYQPVLSRLEQNLIGINSQVDTVIIYNNGVNNSNEFNELISCFTNVLVIGNGANVGVAKALNNLAKTAIQYGAEWLLTLDQDTVVQPHLIADYEKELSTDPLIASLTCSIEDRNFRYDENNEEGSQYVSSCITSGNYINLDVWKKIGGFDEKLFIDKVDTDYCYRLIQNGYKILKIPYVGILHEVGRNTKRHSILGKQFVVFNHSPFRCYYIIRNQIYFARKHKKTLGVLKSIRYQLTAWTRIVVYLLYESNKLQKIQSWIKGIYDGYRISLEE